jgi:galactose-1-phosphate uridylyltransferase
MKNQENIQEISLRIETIKRELMSIGSMRPGSVNEQFKDSKKKTGSYFQLNYTHKMKTKTEYIRKDQVEQMLAETEEYKRFKELIDEWIALSIDSSRLRVKNLKGSRVKI